MEHLEAKLLGRALNILSAQILSRAERVRSLEANERLLKITFRSDILKIISKAIYLFLHCGARRARLRPNFFLSLILGSRVR